MTNTIPLPQLDLARGRPSRTPTSDCNRLSLKQLFAALDSYKNSIPLHILRDHLARLQLSLPEIGRWIEFGLDTYRRNLIHEGRCYQALLLCWKNGQRSPIHDHAGSACGVRVVQGVATETLFERAPNGMIVPTASVELKENAVCASLDADIHQISNLQTNNADLITLHVYSPALLVMGSYSLTHHESQQISEPIYRSAAPADQYWTDGGGI